MNKIKTIIIFLLFILKFVFIPSLLASEEISVQYYFDDRFKSYVDSERIGVKANKQVFYRHTEIFKEALKDSQKLENTIIYKECSKLEDSSFIVKLKPDFFYNPLMQIMYADLEYYFYEEPTGEVARGTLSIEKHINLQALYEQQLKEIYVALLGKLSEQIPHKITEQQISGSFCSLL